MKEINCELLEYEEKQSQQMAIRNSSSVLACYYGRSVRALGSTKGEGITTKPKRKNSALITKNDYYITTHQPHYGVTTASGR